MKSQERWIMVAISLVISVLLIYGVCTSVAKKVVQTSPKGKAGTVVAERNLIPDGEGLVDRKGITHLANGTGIDLAAASEDSHDVAGPSEASENIVNVTHSDETLADNSLLDYSDIAFFTILTNQVGTRADDSDKLRALIGSIHRLRQGRNLSPRLHVIYTGSKSREMIEAMREEISWWYKVDVSHVTDVLGVASDFANTSIAENILPRLIANALYSDATDSSSADGRSIIDGGGTFMYIKFGNVLEPSMKDIREAENSFASSEPGGIKEAEAKGRKIVIDQLESLPRVASDGIESVPQCVEHFIITESQDKIAADKDTLPLKLQRETYDAGSIFKCQAQLGTGEAFSLKSLEGMMAAEGESILASNLGIVPYYADTISQCTLDIDYNHYLLTSLALSAVEDVQCSCGREGRRKLAIGFPTTSKGQEGDTPVFLKVLLPSILDTVGEDEMGKWEINLYLGFDHGDVLFEDEAKRNEIVTSFKGILIGRKDACFNLKMFRLPSIKRVALLWNLLYIQSLRDGNEFFYQVNDDLKMVSKGWLDRFTRALDERNGFGVVGPSDTFHNFNCSLLTQAMVTPIHFEIFGSLYPLELKDWKSDRWLTMVYTPGSYPSTGADAMAASERDSASSSAVVTENDMICFQDVIANNGNAPTRYNHCEFRSYTIYVDEGRGLIAAWKSRGRN